MSNTTSNLYRIDDTDDAQDMRDARYDADFFWTFFKQLLSRGMTREEALACTLVYVERMTNAA